MRQTGHLCTSLFCTPILSFIYFWIFATFFDIACPRLSLSKCLIGLIPILYPASHQQLTSLFHFHELLYGPKSILGSTGRKSATGGNDRQSVAQFVSMFHREAEASIGLSAMLIRKPTEHSEILKLMKYVSDLTIILYLFSIYDYEHLNSCELRDRHEQKTSDVACYLKPNSLTFSPPPPLKWNIEE